MHLSTVRSDSEIQKMRLDLFIFLLDCRAPTADVYRTVAPIYCLTRKKENYWWNNLLSRPYQPINLEKLCNSLT